MLRFNKRSGEDHLLRFARAMGMRYGRAPASEEHMLRFGRAAGGPDQGRKGGRKGTGDEPQYMLTQVDVENLLLSRIGDVPPSCLGSS